MGKKRRADAVDLDAERTLYSSFVCAANSMSQLYSQALQQQRKSSAAASRQTLERVLGFMLRPEHAASDVVSKAALLQFLQQEYENLEGELPHTFPVFPLGQPGGHLGQQQQQPQQGPQQQHEAAAGPHTQPELLKPPSARVGHHGANGLLSPAAKRANSATTSPFSAMDTADHHEASTMLVPGQMIGPQGLVTSAGGGGGLGSLAGSGGVLDGGRSGLFGPGGFTAC